jgi:hypothetical protein
MYNIENEFTSDSSLLGDSTYLKVKESLSAIFTSTNNQSFFGNCVASCDIIQTILTQNGVPCRIVECQVAVIKEHESGEKQYYFVGYDNYSYPGQIDTHTVVITDDKNPILIDISLGYIFTPVMNNVIVERLNSTKLGIMAEYHMKDIRLTYHEKKNLKLPSIHQKNLMQRIVGEQNLEKSLAGLKYFVIAALSLGLINFTLNIVIVILRLFDVSFVK